MTYATVEDALQALNGPDAIDCPQCGRIFREACRKKLEAAKLYDKLRKVRGRAWKMSTGRDDLKAAIEKIPGGLRYFDANFCIDTAVTLDKCLKCKENKNGRGEEGQSDEPV